MKKRLLFVINTMGQAGAERAMIELMKAMDRKRFEIYLFVLLNRGELYKEVPAFVHILNKSPDSGSVLANAKPVLVKLVVKKMIKNHSLFRNIFWIGKNFLAQKRAKRIQIDKLLWKVVSDGTDEIEKEFDAAIAYLEGGAAYYVADHVKAKKKIGFIHIEYEKSGFTPLLDHGCYDKMDRIYTVSHGVRTSFLHMYPSYKEKTKLFYNIINTELIYKQARQGEGFTDGFDGFRIVTIGRLHYQKGYDMAILVLKELKKRYKIRWYILGDGPQRKEIEGWIGQAKLEEDFILLGAVKNPYPYLKQCDLYVHISRFEGKSIAISEAQVLGCAIVASDCAGNREQIIHRENGLLVPFYKKAIIQAIAELIEDDLKRRQYGCKNAQMDFSNQQQLLEFCTWLEERK